MGVGIATLVSNCIVCACFFYVIYRTQKQSVVSFGIRNGLPDRRSIGSIFNVGIGIYQRMMLIVAYNYSAKNHDRMYGIIKFSIRVGIIVSVISIALYECFAGVIMRIFIPASETVLLGTVFLRIRCLATPLMFMGFFTVYVFQGFGEGNKSLFLGIMR